MTTQTTTPETSKPIETLVERWRQAAIAADVPRIIGHYTPDIVAFDAVKTLQFIGTDAYGKHWADCMAMCPGPAIFEVHRYHLEAAGDIGYAHFLMRCGKREDDGTEKASWMRVTQGYRRSGGEWRIAHEHFSAPFDMASGKALFDLQP